WRAGIFYANSCINTVDTTQNAKNIDIDPTIHRWFNRWEKIVSIRLRTFLKTVGCFLNCFWFDLMDDFKSRLFFSNISVCNSLLRYDFARKKRIV
ncbi:hypothetical protein JYT44_03075, partial [Caldithrix abyssi]|nr:hypothetical protein [Caldithrix abyssi]